MAQMTARLYVRMPDALLKELQQEAHDRYLKPSDVAREAIAAHLQRARERAANGKAADAPATADAA